MRQIYLNCYDLSKKYYIRKGLLFLETWKQS